MKPASSQPIAVGFDGSAASCAAVDWAALAAERHGLPLTITTVLDYPGPWTGFTEPEAPVPAELTARAQHLLETAAHRAVKVLPESQVTTTVVQGPPAAVLRTLSESAAMLVLGNRRHNELGALSARSVTFALASHAQGPLVLVPETEAGGGGAVVVGVDGSAAAGRALERAADEAAALGVGLTVASAWSMPMETGAATFAWVGLDPALPIVLSEAAAECATAAAAAARARHPGLVVTEQVSEGRPAQLLSRCGEDAALVVVGSRGRGGFASLLLGSVGHAVVHECAAPVMIVR